MKFSTVLAISVALSTSAAVPVTQKVFDIDGDVEAMQLAEKPEVDSEQLQQLITDEAITLHAEKLYNISKKSIKQYGHPTRVIGSKGHWSTIGYILTELKKLRGFYHVTTQKFPALFGKINDYSLLIDGISAKSVKAFDLTPPTRAEKPVHGKLVAVANYGCSALDFPAGSVNNIVIIKRGECAFGAKSINAGNAGALGAIIYDASPLAGTLGDHTGQEVATVSITEKEAQPYLDKLEADPEAEIEVTLYVDAKVETVHTLNVVAETVDGDHDNVVALGAHSDSVGAGPGINDDGSGTISLLEVAKQLTKFKVNNAVRFAWWAAEEEGLLGSNYYAASLSPEENQRLRVFMDYDMMASPNYELQVYNANNEDHPAGSGDLKQLYIDYYVGHGLNYSLTPFDGRSDYVGFLETGIPSGGIATGADEYKTPEEQAKYGGEVKKWLDPCYHQACDDLSNPDHAVWLLNTKLIAHSVATYAKSFEGFPKRVPLNETAATAGVAKAGVSMKYRGSNLVV